MARTKQTSRSGEKAVAPLDTNQQKWMKLKSAVAKKVDIKRNKMMTWTRRARGLQWIEDNNYMGAYLEAKVPPIAMKQFCDMYFSATIANEKTLPAFVKLLKLGEGANTSVCVTTQ